MLARQGDKRLRLLYAMAESRGVARHYNARPAMRLVCIEIRTTIAFVIDVVLFLIVMNLARLHTPHNVYSLRPCKQKIAAKKKNRNAMIL